MEVLRLKQVHLRLNTVLLRLKLGSWGIEPLLPRLRPLLARIELAGVSLQLGS